MGSTTSVLSHDSATKPKELLSRKDLIEYSLPKYYTTEAVSAKDIENVTTTWDMIIHETSPRYLEMKAAGLTDKSCLVLFYDTFFDYLFQTMPESRSMFTGGIKVNCGILLKMFSMIIKDTEDNDAYKKMMTHLTVTHHKQGVQSNDYGSMGEVIFQALKLTLGTNVFTNEVNKSWIRVFSKKLAIIVPIAVNLELNPEEYETSASTSRRDSQTGVCSSPKEPHSSNPSSPRRSMNFTQCPFHTLDQSYAAAPPMRNSSVHAISSV